MRRKKREGEKMFSSDFSIFLKGSVKIRVEGFFTERFLNLCTAENILLWGIKKEGGEILFANIYAKDFKKIKTAAKKTKSKIKIIKKSGIPFAAHRYRKRKFAFLGGILTFFCIWFYSTHLMGIDIKTDKKITKSEISTALEEFGVYRGVKVKSINRKEVQNNMMTRFGGIAWIGINIRGSRAYVEVREGILKEEGEDMSYACDLVASSDGIIDELDVREGQSLVRSREFVEKGDLLVSGAMDSVQTGIRYVHSYGEVFAFTTKSVSKEYKRKAEEKVATGKKQTKITIGAGDKKINLFLKSEPKYKNFEKHTKKFKSKLLGGIFIEKNEFFEQKTVKVEKTDKEIFEFAKNEIVKKFKSELEKKSEIKKISANFKEKDPETLVVTVVFDLRENIAQERIIDKIENLNYDIGNGNLNAETNQ